MRAQLAAGLALALALAAPGRTADTGTLYATLAAQQDNAVLAIAAQEGGATALLKGSEQYTLFAPTDAAFKKLDDATIRALATKTEVVQRLVRCHLVPGKYTAADLRKRTGEGLKTVHGVGLKIEERKDGLYVGGAKVVTADLGCSNGVIHTLDAVLPVPKE
ncbi:MAG: fasciclin domain-containing protein [Gemmata sp.]